MREFCSLDRVDPLFVPGWEQATQPKQPKPVVIEHDQAFQDAFFGVYDKVSVEAPWPFMENGGYSEDTNRTDPGKGTFSAITNQLSGWKVKSNDYIYPDPQVPLFVTASREEYANQVAGGIAARQRADRVISFNESGEYALTLPPLRAGEKIMVFYTSTGRMIHQRYNEGDILPEPLGGTDAAALRDFYLKHTDRS